MARWNSIALTVEFLFIVIMVVFFALQYPAGDEDFAVYRVASDAFLSGEDPYDFSILLHHGAAMPFHYPPLSPCHCYIASSISPWYRYGWRSISCSQQ
jgi:hypothetical protein